MIWKVFVCVDAAQDDVDGVDDVDCVYQPTSSFFNELCFLANRGVRRQLLFL